MIVNTVAIDYLSLVSRNPYDFERFQDVMLCCEQGRMKQGRLMQYKGLKGQSFFTGAATIQGADHFFFKVSGQAAQRAALVLKDDMPGQCTRIDLQITVPLPYDYSARVLRDGLEWTDWVGHKRPLHIIEQGEDSPFDTVYIGGRNSGDFTRIYVKEDDTGGLWLRFETQFQRRRAIKVWPSIANDRDMMDRILQGRVDAIPEVTDEPGMRAIRRVMGYRAANVSATRRTKQESATYIWLRDVVSPAVARMLNDHDFSEETAELVREWYDCI